MQLKVQVRNEHAALQVQTIKANAAENSDSENWFGSFLIIYVQPQCVNLAVNVSQFNTFRTEDCKKHPTLCTLKSR